MIREWATVISWQEGVALIRCEVKASCNGCASRASCGTHILNKLGPQSEHTLTLLWKTPLVKGQKVELGIAESSLLRAAMLVYLSPLLGLFLLASLCQWMWGTDFAALCGALSGGSCGFFIARHYSRKLTRFKCWQPVILGVAVTPEILRIESDIASSVKS